MSVGINFDIATYEKMIDGFGKTLLRTTVTKTISNLTGEETLTESTTGNITGTFFRKVDAYTQEQIGLLRDADAVAMVKSGVTLNKNDLLTYDGEEYRVVSVVTRRLGTRVFYKVAHCFKNE